MIDTLTERLNQILHRVTSDAFLHSTGLGNEIAFYIFDYPPEAELCIREHVRFLLEHIPKTTPRVRVQPSTCWTSFSSISASGSYSTKPWQCSRPRVIRSCCGNWRPILHPNRTAAAFAAVARPHQHDLVLVSGVGSVYPLLRVHTLLNNLHAVMGQTPLVLFYPGHITARQSGCLVKCRTTTTTARSARAEPGWWSPPRRTSTPSSGR